MWLFQALSLLTFICSVVKYWAPIGGGWVDFVSMTAFICTLLLFLFHLMGIINQIPLPMNMVVSISVPVHAHLAHAHPQLYTHTHYIIGMY